MPEFDRPHMTIWEAIGFVAFGIPEGDAGQQWEEAQIQGAGELAKDDEFLGYLQTEHMKKVGCAQDKISDRAAKGEITVTARKRGGGFQNIDPIDFNRPGDDWLHDGGALYLIDPTGDSARGSMSSGGINNNDPWIDFRFDPQEIQAVFGAPEDEKRLDGVDALRTFAQSSKQNESQPIETKVKPGCPDSALTGPDTPDKRESAPKKRGGGNPDFTRGDYYERLETALESKAKVLQKNDENLTDWFLGMSRRKFREAVEPALRGATLPSDRHLSDMGKRIVAEIESRHLPSQ